MKKLFALIYLLLAFVGRIQSQEIFEVIKANDFETVKTIISDNPLVKDQLDARGRTVLFYAIDAKNIEILNYLIVSQVNMNTKDVLGRTPLMYSLFSTDKDTRFARALILAGAKIDEKDSFGYTALEYAAQAGSKKIVELLIEKNIIIPIDPPNGNRLLHFSVQNGLRNLMKILVEKGVSTKISGLLHSAATNGQDEIIKDLLNLRININQVSQGWTPLHIASYNGKISTIELLLENGADLHARTAMGQSSANLADENGKYEALDYLVSKGLMLDKPIFPVLTGDYLGQSKPGRTAEVFAPIIFDTPYTLHSNIIFSPDGKEALWSNAFGDNFTFVSRFENGIWTYPVKAVSQGIAIEDVPVFHPNGHLFYDLARFRQHPSGAKRDKEDIWVWERNGQELSNPRPLPEEINMYRLHWQFSVDRKGSIYFHQAIAGGEGADDICVSKLKNGAYQKIVSMGKGINSKDAEGFPYIHPDEDYILFTRNRDIYVSFRNKNGEWNMAKPLGSEVNTSGLEILPVVTPDGRYLFFCRDHRLYWISSIVIEELRPKE